MLFKEPKKGEDRGESFTYSIAFNCIIKNVHENLNRGSEPGICGPYLNS